MGKSRMTSDTILMLKTSTNTLRIILQLWICTLIWQRRSIIWFFLRRSLIIIRKIKSAKNNWQYPLDYVLIGDRLQKGRGKTATQEYVAEMVGCSSNYLSSIECGKKRVSLELLCRLCAYLDLSLDYVVGGIVLSNGIPTDFNELFRQLTDDQRENIRALMISMCEQNKKRSWWIGFVLVVFYG